MGEAGELQALCEIELALERSPVASALGKENVEVDLHCPVYAAGRVLSFVSGELTDVIFVAVPEGSSTTALDGSSLGANGGESAVAVDPVLTVETGVQTDDWLNF